MTRRLSSAAMLALAGSASLAVVLTMTGTVPAISQPVPPQAAAPATQAAAETTAVPAMPTANAPINPAPATAPAPAEAQPAALSGDLSASIARPFGRHGPLTERERAMAETAWQYFVKSYQPDTGLVNAVGSYPSTTL